MNDHDRAELEANWFAMAFLMPSEQFVEKWQETNGNIYEIADYFRVSTTHATLRAQGLGLLIKEAPIK